MFISPKHKLLAGASVLAMPMLGHLSDYAFTNTLTRLIPDLYAGLDVVSRELVGFIPSVSRNSTAERAAVGEAVVWPIAPPTTGINIAPAMVVPEPRDQTIGNGTITITKARAFEFGFVGEEQVGLNNGAGYGNVQAGMFAQALRAITNEIEVDLGNTAMLGASRVWGVAGTTPFATNLSEIANLKKILDDNGAPASGRSLIINTSSGVNLLGQTQLTKANEAGTDMTLRSGELLNLFGFSIKESNGTASHTAGTAAASATTDATGYAKGTTVINTAAAGTGTIVAGDVIVFAGDSNKYVVAVGIASVAAAGTITLAAPGLMQAMSAATHVITLQASYASNPAFVDSAMQLAIRAPAAPSEGDMRMATYQLVDPRSGLGFEVSIWAGYRKVRYEVAAAWGTANTKSAHTADLIG